MKELDIYSVECRKHGMTYGQYVAAIDHGELPPPIAEENKRKRKAPENQPEDFYKHFCERCGQPFFTRYENSKALYCPECVHSARKGVCGRPTVDSRKECKICKQLFDRGRDKRGVINNRTLCDRCRELWRSLGVEEKRIFTEEPTFERLEELIYGRKKNR